MNKEMRENIFWVLHEVSVLEEVLRNIKDGLLEDLRTDALEDALKPIQPGLPAESACR